MNRSIIRAYARLLLLCSVAVPLTAPVPLAAASKDDDRDENTKIEQRERADSEGDQRPEGFIDVRAGSLTFVPGKFAIAAFSPRLNEAGNSIRAMKATRYIAGELGLGLYGPNPD